MHPLQILLFTIILFGGFNTTTAQNRVSANPRPIVISQADSSQITIIIKGDEKCHWKETEDGYTVLENKKGIYEYAKLNWRKRLVCSRIKANNKNQRSAKEEHFLEKVSKSIRPNGK